MLDLQYWLDNKNNNYQFITEFKYGKMIGKKTGAWIRAGKHISGEKNIKGDWSIMLGIRFINF